MRSVISMDRGKALMFLFSAAVIVLMPNTHAQPHQRPLCVSQYSLVNYACASLSYAPKPGAELIATPPSPDDDGLADDESGGDIGSDAKRQNIQVERHEGGHGSRHENHRNGNGHGQQQGHGHEGHGRHERGHGNNHRDGDRNEHGDDDDDDGDHHGHRRGHGRRHRHRHRPHPKYESSEMANCCRWLKELDDECVCDLLTRLPPFLSKPLHDYTISVGQSCEITYHCW